MADSPAKGSVFSGKRWVPDPTPPNPDPPPPWNTPAEIAQACCSIQRSLICSPNNWAVLKLASHWTGGLWNGARLLENVPAPPPMPELPKVELRPGRMPRVPEKWVQRVLSALDDLRRWAGAGDSLEVDVRRPLDQRTHVLVSPKPLPQSRGGAKSAYTLGDLLNELQQAESCGQLARDQSRKSQAAGPAEKGSAAAYHSICSGRYRAEADERWHALLDKPGVELVRTVCVAREGRFAADVFKRLCAAAALETGKTLADFLGSEVSRAAEVLKAAALGPKVPTPMKPESLTAAGRERKREEYTADSDPQTDRKVHGKTKLATAMVLVQEHPEWSDRFIAQKAGYKSHAPLSRNKTYQAAAAMARGRKEDLPQGTKDGETGSIEAWQQDDEED